MVNQIEKEPLVSVVMATLNAEKFISDALTSIFAQTYPRIEIILIDGQSTDNTKNIVAQYPHIKFISQAGKGLFDAWNQGINMSKGEFVAILDSDDYWEPTTISNHLIALMQDDTKLGSIGHVQFFIEANQTPPPEFKLSLLAQSHLAYMPGCFVGRRAIFDKIGYYETDWKVASDIIWFAKVKELKEEIVLLDQVVLHKRVHNQNVSYTSVEEDVYGSELLKLLHEKIRQRNNAS